MPSREIIDTKTMEFARQNAHRDINQLALQAHLHKDIDIASAIRQIKGLQQAARKFDSWQTHDGIIYPPAISLEQASSTQTARHKKAWTQTILREITTTPHSQNSPTTLIDLTGGMGVDCAMISTLFDRAVYVEQDSLLCDLARRNFATLGITNIDICNTKAEDYLTQAEDATIIYVDPARRDAHHKRTYALEDCTPDILLMLDKIFEHTNHLLVKLSPMLDIKAVYNQLQAKGFYVKEMHIVAIQNECKELLIHVVSEKTQATPITCINDDQHFSTTIDDIVSSCQSMTKEQLEIGGYLYEPNAAIMKCGCFREIERRYQTRQISPNSHLFHSQRLIDDFPGRSLRIRSIKTMTKKNIKDITQTVSQANITTRNFPLTAPELRAKLKLKDGGSCYIMGTSTADRKNILVLCDKP